MSTALYSVILIAVMAGVTIFLRALPFVLFPDGKSTPEVILYLGRVLPPAIIGMLVIYCLKDIHLTEIPFGIPELLASVCVVLLQVWKRNSLVSILAGTAVYMILINAVVPAVLN